MTNGTDQYSLVAFDEYLNRMERTSQDWLRERLSDQEFLALYNSKYVRCVQLQETDEVDPTSRERAEREDELLRHFREMRKLLDSIEFTIRECRKYGQTEVPLLQKIAVLSRCLTQLDFDYRPVTAGSRDQPPPPAASP